MKSKTKVLVVVAAVAAVIGATTLISSAGGPPAEIVQMIIERLTEVFTRLGERIPFLKPLFDFILNLLTGVFNGGG
jgi:hypothetical protein